MPATFNEVVSGVLKYQLRKPDFSKKDEGLEVSVVLCWR